MNCRKDILIFLGPPGAGKGSLSRLCVRRLGWTQLSTGNLLRSHIGSQTEIGKEIDFVIKSGKLISDELIFEMVKNWLNDKFTCSDKIILDGFPRTVAQASLFMDFLKVVKDYNINLTIIKMIVDDGDVIRRLSGRLICQNGNCQAVYSVVENSSLKSKCEMVCDDCFDKLSCREDDDVSVVRDRLLTYRKHESDLESFYASCGGKVFLFNAQLPLEEVYDNFLSVINDSIMESV